MDLSICRAGDIIGVADDSWLSHSIRDATGGGPVSHIQIVTAVEPFAQVTEALDHVRVNPLEARLAQVTAAYLLSPISVSDADRIQAVRIALGYVSDRYGYGDILLQGMDSVTRTQFWCNHFAEQAEPICSMLASLAYPSLHLDTKAITPNDWVRLASANTSTWLLHQLK
jgi:hypothetical protein